MLIAANNGRLFRTSGFALFNYQAHAFLSGHLNLVTLPPSIHDLSFFNGQFYLYWQPFPAVVLMPFVALFGVGFPDVLFNAVLGGANVALVALLLRNASAAGLAPLSDAQRGLMALTFALGTAHLPLAAYGRVWFTAQLVGFACLALAYLASVRLGGVRAWLAAGLAIAGATMTRSHLVFAGLWPLIALFVRFRDERRDQARGSYVTALLARGAAIAAPVAAAVVLVLAFNHLRFGDAFETGIKYQQMDEVFRAEFDRFGAFSLHYLPTNLFYQYVYYPFPLSPKSMMGGSLFLLTPLFLAVFWAFKQPAPRWSPWVLAASCALVAVPILLLMGTGWRQWGPRYTIDFTVPLLLLTAHGLRHWPPWAIRAATGVSVVGYLIGTLYFGSRIP